LHRPPVRFQTSSGITLQIVEDETSLGIVGRKAGSLEEMLADVVHFGRIVATYQLNDPIYLGFLSSLLENVYGNCRTLEVALQLCIALGGSLKNLIRCFGTVCALVKSSVLRLQVIELHNTCDGSDLVQGDFGISEIVC
jgi:hypothetical protein